MLPLRYPQFWMLAGWLLVAGVVLGSVAPGDVLGDLPFSDEFMHGVSYGLLMLWFSGLYVRRLHGWIALLVFALGIAMEIVQSGLSYRSFDPEDMLANAIGIGVGLGLSLAFFAGWCLRVETLLLRSNDA